MSNFCTSQAPSALLPEAAVNNNLTTRCAALRASIVHSVSFEEIELVEDGLLVYDPSTGVIQGLVDLQAIRPVEQQKLLLSAFGSRLQDFRGKLLIPGFVDAHCHAPQYVFTGTGMDLPLLAWLEKYTFPCEARFADVDFAKVAYAKSIQRHLKCGTTFASYFATIHNDAGKVLVDVINRVGQRAFVGKVSMDRNSPDFYIEDTQLGCQHAEDFAQYVLARTEYGRMFLQSLQAQGKIRINPECTESTLGAGLPPVTSMNSLVASILPSANTTELAPTGGSVGKRPRTVSISDTMSRTSSLQSIAALGGDPSGGDGSLAVASGGTHRPFSAMKKARTISMSSLPDAVEGGCEQELTNGSPLHHSISYGLLEYDESERPAFEEGTLLNQQNTPLVLPCITPRFVPTCTGDMMQALGDIASRYGLPVQSHLSESINEIQWVKELHPDCMNYADVYRKYGLLHNKVYMAHCCHSDAEERRMLAQTGCGVVHCASSNFNLNSGAMDVRQFKSEGIKVALGTDVAGGYSPSMLDALRQSIICSKFQLFDSRKAATQVAQKVKDEEQIPAESCHSNTTSATDGTDDITDDSSLETDTVAATATATTTEYKTLTYKEAFYLATMGGAEVLGMDQVVGNFMPGKKLDCLVVDSEAEDGPFDVFEGETAIDHFQKFLFLGDDRNIMRVYVDGQCVL